MVYASREFFQEVWLLTLIFSEVHFSALTSAVASLLIFNQNSSPKKPTCFFGEKIQIPSVQSISTLFQSYSAASGQTTKQVRNFSIPTCERLQDTKVSKITASALQAKTGLFHISPLWVKVHGTFPKKPCAFRWFLFGSFLVYDHTSNLGCFSWNSMGIPCIFWPFLGWSLDPKFTG